MKIISQSIRMLAVLSLLAGVVYPVLMTGLAKALFRSQANGSIIDLNGTAIGSQLLGQSFSSNRYFWPRPSAVGYNPLPSGATNQGPTSTVLRDSVAARATRFGAPVSAVPPDLLYASGSCLDPHISPEAALFQMDRVLAGRGMAADLRDELELLVGRYTEYPQWGVFGEPRVNVLRLNLALDSLNQ